MSGSWRKPDWGPTNSFNEGLKWARYFPRWQEHNGKQHRFPVFMKLPHEVERDGQYTNIGWCCCYELNIKGIKSNVGRYIWVRWPGKVFLLCDIWVMKDVSGEAWWGDQGDEREAWEGVRSLRLPEAKPCRTLVGHGKRFWIVMG